MIEKFFDKTYKCNVSQSTLTRAANRLISEYCYTFGNTVAPDELQEIAKQIKQCVDTTEYEDESNYEYNGYGVFSRLHIPKTRNTFRPRTLTLQRKQERRAVPVNGCRNARS